MSKSLSPTLLTENFFLVVSTAKPTELPATIIVENRKTTFTVCVETEVFRWRISETKELKPPSDRNSRYSV